MSSQVVIINETLFLRPAHEYNPESVQTVHCLRCGRKLTAPSSVAAGIGPVCARNVAYEARRRLETPTYSYTPRTKAYFKRKDRKATSFSSKKRISPKYVSTIDFNAQFSAAENSISSPIPYCSCCERHNVQGQVNTRISVAVGRDIFVCTGCLEAQCNLKGVECYVEHMNRPSPIPDYNL